MHGCGCSQSPEITGEGLSLLFHVPPASISPSLLLTPPSFTVSSCSNILLSFLFSLYFPPSLPPSLPSSLSQLHVAITEQISPESLHLQPGSPLLTSIKQCVVELARSPRVIASIQSAAQSTLRTGWLLLLPTVSERASTLSQLLPASEGQWTSMEYGNFNNRGTFCYIPQCHICVRAPCFTQDTFSFKTVWFWGGGWKYITVMQ